MRQPSMALFTALLFTPCAVAADATDVICRALLHEEEQELEEIRLELDLARSEESAAQKIYELLDGLWKNQHVERMVYLAGKHDRDVARLRVRWRDLRVERQSALLEQYAGLCEASPPAEARSAADEAFSRYLAADCEALATRASMAEVDLEFRKEVQASVLDLRRNEVATRQQVIIAERDVEMAGKELQRQRRRAAECRRQLPPRD